MLVRLCRKTLHIVVQNAFNRLKHPKRNAQINITWAAVNLNSEFGVQHHLTWRGNFCKTKVGFLSHEIKLNFVDEFPERTNINIVGIRPLRGVGCWIVDPGVVYIAIDNMFGGEGRLAPTSTA
jgi:hypothetical protein